MSVYALDKFLNNVFDIYAMPGMSNDFTYNKEEYYVTSNDKEWIIEMPLPGMSKENLKIDFQDSMLIISANPSINSKAVRNIKKSWALDESVDVTSITAKLENGLLTVVLPKIKPEKKSISINIS
jgi:HSP20 family protein